MVKFISLLALLILVNVMIAIIFKFFPKYKVRNFPAIVVNYFTCVLVGELLPGHSLTNLGELQFEKWAPYALALSVTFITGFNILAKTFQLYGIAFTTIVQKMSIILSAFFGIIVFHEVLNLSKGTGLVLAIVSIVLVNYPFGDQTEKEESSDLTFPIWVYPLLTFIIAGMVEILLLIVSKKNLAPDNVTFVAVSFGMAGIWGLIYLILKVRPIFTKRDIIGGIVLGVPNFFSIYMLPELLGLGYDGSVVFPINNIGILVVSALIGIYYFHEPVNKWKLWGMVLALISIALIGLA